MCDQLLGFISFSVSTDLSAYRKSYSCSNVLVKCVENWRKVEKYHHVGCILIFDSKVTCLWCINQIMYTYQLMLILN